jgi:hypothetical protein
MWILRGHGLPAGRTGDHPRRLRNGFVVAGNPCLPPRVYPRAERARGEPPVEGTGRHESAAGIRSDLVGDEEVAPRRVPARIRDVRGDLQRHLAEIGGGRIECLTRTAHRLLGLARKEARVRTEHRTAGDRGADGDHRRVRQLKPEMRGAERHAHARLEADVDADDRDRRRQQDRPRRHLVAQARRLQGNGLGHGHGPECR